MFVCARAHVAPWSVDYHLELRLASLLGPCDDQNLAIAEVDRGGLGRPLRSGRQLGLDGGLCPACAIVAADELAPRVARAIVTVVSREPTAP